MSSEANRISNAIKSNGDGTQVYISDVNVTNVKEITSVATKVETKYPDVIVMALAAPKNTVLVSLTFPLKFVNDCNNQLTGSSLLQQSISRITANVKDVVVNITDVSETIRVAEIVYPLNAGHFPLKLKDDVRSDTFTLLKKVGLLSSDNDDESDIELNFDDIE